MHVHDAVMHDMIFMRYMRATWAVSGTLEVPQYVHLGYTAIGAVEMCMCMVIQLAHSI